MTIQTRIEAIRQGGETVGFVVVWEDVTQQLADQRAADESQSALRSVLGAIVEQASALTSAATGVGELSSRMAGDAAETTQLASEMATSSEEVSRSVESLSAGAEEMTASIREISRTASEAVGVANDAVDAARATNAVVAALGASSAGIGEIVRLITSIARQTNLLALNATIEAARAGESGRGFAVVASEVKDLARETAAAADRIGQRIDAIQRDAGDSATAISAILSTISTIAEMQQTIAAAVEEQEATTAEMARNMTEASVGTRQITAGIVTLDDTAHRVAVAAADGNRSAGHLTDLADVLARLAAEIGEAPERAQ